MNEVPNTGRQTRLVLATAAALALVWTVGAVAVPWLAAQGSLVGGWLRLVYRTGCHQIAERCIDLGFGPTAVCARCMGLYLGGCLGLVATTLCNRSWRPKPRWLAVFAAPTVLDFVAGQLGLPSLDNWPRLALALPLGLLAGLYLGDGLTTIIAANSGPRRTERQQDSVG